jgi:acyl transferase domain-containing protein/NADPH:quinone reductase-like Zn-dependent oxidoreductase/thioesterase domain-containing protein/acyl carrier protein
MSDLAQRLAKLSPAQRQLLERRLEKSRTPASEPIAMIGMACRFPGAPTLDAYWQLILEGRNAAREVPPDRWNIDDFYDPTGEVAGKMPVRWAALIDAPDEFDPQFFGITPREAARMDPQQRLLLEVAWEAMENAGRPADQLAGSRTGVFIGIGGTDYSKVCVPYEDYFQQIDAHMGTGNALSIAANRISYVFDFHGPSAAVDTACSSSSLAIHLAVESLRRGESDAALAGGANMILTPETTIAFAKARMLSPDGVCRPFDAGANGYVRGEGCGLVLLKRLADAKRDGDAILAVLRATSVNQDGRTSGISAPNSQSQIACIHAALQQAGLSPGDIGYIEAHGTGTPLGDPIEMQALCEIFREAGDGFRPCYVSSVKANVGHMETVSGAAGLIKVVLMMQHEQIARQANFESLNPHINLDGTRLLIPQENIDWRRGVNPRIAGVSSFGFGGTNTHLIVESFDFGLQISDGGLVQTPKSQSAARMTSAKAFESSSPQRTRELQFSDRPIHVLKLTGRNSGALALQAERLAEYLAVHPGVDAAAVGWSQNTGRADFNYRAAIATTGVDELQQQLRKLSAGEATAISGVKLGSIRAVARPKVAFLFTGQGLQYVGMGRGLYQSHPVFRQALEHCDEILRRHWDGRSLLDILYPDGVAFDDPTALLQQTAYTQPGLFSLEYALAELWRSWGVVPDIVLGHSVGEYAAACVAGVMSLQDGLGLIAERSRLMQAVTRPGKMAVVFAPHDQVSKELHAAAGQVVVAVLNGPDNVVISGDANAVERISEKLAADGVQVKMLNVSHAFHSPLMDEMLDEFERFARSIEFRAPQMPVAANLTGQLMTTAPTARYWRDHLRNTVQFAEGMARVAEAQPSVLIEIGPTASLLGMGRRCVPKLDAAWLPSLRAGQDDWHVLASSVAEYYCRGGPIDWRGWDRPWPRHRLMLPNYPFQRSRHWLALDPARRRTFAQDGEAGAWGATSGAAVHPLLGARLSTVWSNTLFEARLSARSPAYLVDHQVQGSPVTPAAAYIEQGLAAAEQVFGSGRHGVENLVIQQAMFLPDGARRRVQVSIAPESGGTSAFEIYSKPADESASAAVWTMHVHGTLVHESRQHAKETASQPPLIRICFDDVRGRASVTTSRKEFYQRMIERGLAYGPAFQVLDELCQCPNDALARIDLPESVRREANRYHLHPAIGDALLQSMAGVVPREPDGSFSAYTYMPVGIRRVVVASTRNNVDRPLYSYAVRTSADAGSGPERVEGNVYLLDESGEILVVLEGVQVQRLGRSNAVDPNDVDTARWLYRVAWRELPLETERQSAASAASTAGAWLIFADTKGVGRGLADRLTAAGQSSVLVEPGEKFRWSPGDSGNGKPGHAATAQLEPLNESHYRELLDKAFLAPGRVCRGIVHVWSLDIPEAGFANTQDPSAARVFQVARRLGCGSVMQLIRACTRVTFPTVPPLWMVTAGAQAVEGVDGIRATPVFVQQSPLVGLGRVAAIELPDLRPRLVDLDPQATAQRAGAVGASLAEELRADSSEGEVAYRGDRRFVPRLVRDVTRITNHRQELGPLNVPVGQPFQLRITKAGSLDALRLLPVDREPPSAGQVEIKVHAAGLNFSDVLKALGLYPGIKDVIVPLGIEASGVVTAVGEGVTRFRVGDEIFGVVPYAFSSHARTADYAMVHKPMSIDHDQACTIPITFLTAYYSLVHLAQLQPGERVLIHAGAGGVGLAAIQIAQHLGAEVLATAGSDNKREFLRSLGVRHVYSSRTSAFADEILAATNREGVDVVLNSLPGEAINKSLSILRAYGRFLEIGKTDIYQNRMIGLLPFQDNLSYFAIDLDRMLRQRPNTIRELFADVMRHFEDGQYRPLMFTRFEVEQTTDAFRYMQQRKNIGKVVVSIADGGTQRVPGISDSSNQSAICNPQSEMRFVRTDATYLITGGTGALGLQVGEWLAKQGAGVIALLSRGGATPEIVPSLERIRQHGSSVIVLKGDVADRRSLDNALRQLPAGSPPLRGVVHAAGVLADGVLADMSLEQLDRATAPKVQGAWNLHLATLDRPLELFVTFSSVASVLGSPGQANYAAANAYMDALTHYRRANGLPATTINWGPWAGSGMASEATQRAPGDQAVKSRGMALLEPELGLEILGRIWRADVPQVAVMNAQWEELCRLLGVRLPAMLSEMAAEVQQASGAQVGSRVDQAFRQRLLAADAITRQSLVSDYIRDELARIMGIEPTKLEIEQPLSTFGLDSLLALELKNNLEGRLDFTLPMAKLMEGPSIASLAEETVRLVAGRETTAAEAVAEEWVPLLALRSGGTRPPLVLLPALGGDVRCYADLVQQLDEDQPVYAFRPRGADQELPPHLSMAEMMADYVAALRQLQPAGPYYLAGWSTGGIFAAALAEALERTGEAVAFVFLFDTPLPSICDEVNVDDDARFLCDLANYANRFAGTDLRIDYDKIATLSPEEQFQSALDEARRQGTIPAETPVSLIRRLVHVGEANVRVIQRYKPHSVTALIHLFIPVIKGGLAEVSGRDMPEDEDHGWSIQLGKPIEVHELPGDHFTMMVGEGAAQLAGQLTMLLSRPAPSTRREPEAAR